MTIIIVLQTMKRSLDFFAKDGYVLSGLLFEPDKHPQGAILLCPGLGIPKEFYAKYGAYLADEGYLTLLFDYRGIGEQVSQESDERVNLQNWGLEDIPGALTYLNENYPKLKITMIGHSVGGQVAGLIINHHLVDRFIFIATTGGYWPIFDFRMKLLSWFMFNVHIPITTRIFGYLPPSLTYRGVRIAKGVALEWAYWSRQKKYISALFGKEIKHNYYKEIKHRIDWIWSLDDEISVPAAVQSMMDYYTNATIINHPIDPSSLGIAKIGHAGFFTSSCKEKLWRFPLDLIEQGELN